MNFEINTWDETSDMIGAITAILTTNDNHSPILTQS